MEDATINYGHCTRCGAPLEEAEFALGNVCDGCRPQFMETWGEQQAATAEMGEELHRYPEESNDDCEYCGGRGCKECCCIDCDGRGCASCRLEQVCPRCGEWSVTVSRPGTLCDYCIEDSEREE